MLVATPPKTYLDLQNRSDVLQESHLTEETPVGMLPTQDFCVTCDTITSEIDIALRKNPDLPGVIVVCKDGDIRLTSRRFFYEVLGKRYGVAVFLKRPVQFLLEAVEAQPLIVPETYPIPDTVRLALSRSLDQIYEPILIEFDQKDYRILDVHTLLLAQSELFANLQNRLSEINQELEKRVETRTKEIVQINRSLQKEIDVRRRAETMLEIRLDYEQALTHCANALLSGMEREGVILEALTYLLDAAKVSRVFVAERVDLDKAGSGIRLAHQVQQNGIEPIPSHNRVFQQGSLGNWINMLWAEKWVIGQIDKVPQREQELLAQLDLVSVLLLPIGQRENWYGLIGFGEVDTNRDWDRNDIQLLRTVAQMLYAFIERRRNAFVIAAARDEAVKASNFKSELLAKVSHELRTPLGAILGYSQLLSYGSYGELAPEQKQVTELVINSSKYLSTLVNGILDQAQLDNGQLSIVNSSFNVREMIAEVESRIQVLAHNKGLDFRVEILPQVPEVIIGDLLRTQQVLTNLLGNAVKFTEEGYVKLRVDLGACNYLIMDVIDTGPGISPEDQSGIFEPFTQVDGSPTRRFSGTGLGLSISHQLVKLMKGKIELVSELGVGSTFSVHLPIITQHPVEKTLIASRLTL